jgi:surface protein
MFAAYHIVNCNYLATSSFNRDIGGWGVSNVTDMSGMFKGSGFNQNIGRWDVSKVKNMSEMFSGYYRGTGETFSYFNHDIGSWDVSNVTDMSRMFFYDLHFNQDISSWDVSNVTNMSEMFYCAAVFNQDIGSWDVRNVTDMEGMFSGFYFPAMTPIYTGFNQDLSEWCVENISSEPNGFATLCSLRIEYYPVWGTCYPVEIDEIEYNGSVNIYPNPTNTLITLETIFSGLCNIEISTLNGQLLFSKELEGTTHQLDLSTFQPGVYFITIRSKDFVTTKKIIKLNR